MPNIAISIDITGYVEEVDKARTKDIPFVTAKALTRTAQDSQSEVRRNIQRDFTLRNSWTQQNVKITPAEKLSWPITAEVYTDTGNNAGAPDYLIGQEEGGEKVAHNGHQHIAIPTKYLRSLIGNSTVIPAALRPNELLKAFTATHVSRRSEKDVRTPSSQQYVGFKQYIRGELYILVRRPGKSDNRDVVPFYLLVPEAKLRPVLEMEETVERICEERFETNWDDAWADLRR